MGFSTVWLSLTTRVPRVLAQTAVFCRMYEMPLHGSFYPVLIFGLSRATCILSYMTIRLANKLILKSFLCSIVFSTRLNSFSKINCLSFYFLDPLVYLLEHPLSPASGMLPTGLQYNGYFINTLFITSTHHCLSLLIAFNTLFLSRLLCFLLLWM